MNGPWVLLRLQAGWSDTLIPRSAAGQCTQEWEPWLASTGESEGRLILDRSIFLTPTYLAFCSHHLHSHRDVYAHIPAVDVTRASLSPICIYLRPQDSCSHELSKLFWHYTRSPLLLNLNINSSCITVVFPSIKLSMFARLVDTPDNLVQSSVQVATRLKPAKCLSCVPCFIHQTGTSCSV